VKAEIGIIGGSGLYSMPGFETQEEVHIETPFGRPSDNYVLGKLGGHSVAFLARHGRGHRLSPSELNFRANVYGMKSLGVERIISLSAVGSLKDEHHPLDFVIPDQFFDRTRGRVSTFFGDGLVAHVSFAHPVCPEICYVTIAMVTDYDCWHPDHDAVTVNEIITHLVKNAENACKVVAQAVAKIPAARSCQCGSALSHAIITDRKMVPEATRRKLGILIDKYFV